MLNFLGIGAQKCGTTWLYVMLSKNPKILFPGNKEIHFWDLRQHLGIAWYNRIFTTGQPEKIQGEITPAYAVLSLEDVEKIYHFYPNIRLIFLMRNPIERAWSSSLMALVRAEMKFEEASDQWFIDHFNSRASLIRGDYETCLRTWLSVFHTDQMIILDYDEIEKSPRKLLTKCCEHLGLKPDFYSSVDKQVLQEKVFESPPYNIRASLRPVLVQIYRERILRLCEYLGKDFSSWLSQ